MFLNDFLSLVLNCREISPKKRRDKISKCFSTVKFTGDSVKTLSITFKPSKESAVRDHLLFCDNDPSFEELSCLAKASSKFFFEIKESLLIKRDTRNLNRNTASVELLLFDSR